VRSLLGNPILAREVTHRMRDNRTFFVPMIYLSVLALVTVGVYLTMTWTAGLAPGAMTVQGWEIGVGIFHAVAFVQMALVVLLVPSVSASAITAERDKGTLVPLLVTPLPRGQITVGKLIAPILYVLLLLSTSIPFAALSFGFGGTDLRLLGVTYGCLLSTVLFFAALGLMISTLLRRTVPAVLLAYGLVAVVVIGTGVADMIVNLMLLEPADAPIVFLYLNPFTPLVLNIEERLSEMPGAPIWWITPVVQLGLGALFALIAALRIRSMRE
jgi:ABC-type transport system involved in multi-copper enzyme maturation permease subunit